MKKIFTLSALCIAAVTSAYALPEAARPDMGKIVSGESVVSNVKAVDPEARVQGIPTRAEMNPITSQPAGDIEYFWMNGSGTYPDGGSIKHYNMTDGCARIIWGDDNKVYVRDFFEIEEAYDLGITTYIEGELQGDKIVFQLPQALFEYGGSGSGIFIAMQAYEITDEGYMPDETVTEVTFDYDRATGDVNFAGIGENKGLAMFYLGGDFAGWWTGYSQERKSYTFNDVQMVTIPDTAEKIPYVCWLSDEFNFECDIYKDGDKFYFARLSQSYPGLTVMGYLEDQNICVIPSRQFIGIANYCFIWNTAQDSNNAQVISQYDFFYDYSTGDFYMLDEDVFLSYGLFAKFPTGTEVFLPIMQYLNFFLFRINETSGTPSDPTGLRYTDDGFELNYHTFEFNLPIVATNDNFLNSEDLYYSIYRNYELMVFQYDPEEYIYLGISEPTTEIPYNFSNGNDIYRNGTLHQVGIYDLYSYDDPTNTLSVVLMYKNGGTETFSNLVTLDVNTGKVTTENFDSVETVTAPVESESWYDLSGRRVENPVNGMYIKQVKYSDGSVRSFKVARK